jgi:hypothetical protein
MRVATIVALAAMTFVAVLAVASPARPEPIEPGATLRRPADHFAWLNCGSA